MRGNDKEPKGVKSLHWDEQLFLAVYQFGMNVLVPMPLAALAPILGFTRKRRNTLFPRLGFQPFPNPSRTEGGRNRGGEKTVWIHALSVGEVLSAVPLVREIHQRLTTEKLYLSVSTLSGYEIARGKLQGLLDGLFFFPLDLLFAVRRSFSAVKPSLVVLVETDIWPGFMAEIRRRRVPSLLINGRLSPRSFKRYAQAKRLFSPALNTFCRVYPQSLSDAERYCKLGVCPQKIARPGNLKFDAASLSSAAETREPVAVKLGIQEGERVLVAGSTHEGEEEILRVMFLRLRGSMPRLKLIVVPRHPDRAKEICRLFDRDAVHVVLYSELPQKAFDVAVVDEFGVLSVLYEFGDVAYVGGSLVPKGGQNPVEPAAAGKPVLFGPDMSDFLPIADLMLKEGGAVQVKNEEELAKNAYRVLSDRALGALLGAKNKTLVERHCGVTLTIAEDILEHFLKI